jgi:hypothetical protein
VSNEYELAYRDGFAAGAEYPCPEEWRSVYGGSARTVRGHGRTSSATAAGWMRGFRHACIERAS